MTKSIVKPLLVLISALLLTSCSNTPSSKLTPAPKFPTCKVVQDWFRCGAPEETWRYGVYVINIMAKLREMQPKEERDEFASCTINFACHGNGPVK